MNISYNWLKDLIPLDLSPEEIASLLTRVGLAVEGIHQYKDDLVFDIDLTSNRPDCLSHLGVARELGVILECPIQIADAAAPASDVSTGLVTIESPELCNRFTARVIHDVKVGPSPQWLVDRLEAVGERTINNIADITNYVMLELGQPMHAFDLDRLKEKRIVVRTANAGEKISTLDEVERSLDEEILAICDAEKPVAVAGIMGGFQSGITTSTTNVLLEVAYFKRETIRHTSRKLGLATEASYRFERGVDIENLIRASERAANLICQLAGGRAGDFVDVYPEPKSKRSIFSTAPVRSVKRLTGLDVSPERCESILSSLGIERVREGQYLSPAWRHDISIEEDLVEEIARHFGYENISEEIPPAFQAGEYQPNEKAERCMRSHLVSSGFMEAITYSFIDTNWDQRIQPLWSLQRGTAPGYITLKYSVIDGATRMRASCIPGLLEAARHNFNHQMRDLKLFEVGKVFVDNSDGKDLPVERKYLTLLMSGNNLAAASDKPTDPIDIFHMKGVIEALLDQLGLSSVDFGSTEVTQFRRGQTAFASHNGNVLGVIGRLADDISKEMKFRKPVYLAEMDLDEIFRVRRSSSTYSPLNSLPLSQRDITFLVDAKVDHSSLHKALLENATAHCSKVAFYDVYFPEEKGLKAITFRLSFVSSSKTLTDEQIDSELREMISAAELRFQGLVKVQA